MSHADVTDGVVVDIENESGYTAFSVPRTSPPLFVSWAPVGSELFASTYSYGASSTTIVYHSVSAHDTPVAEVPFGGLLSFIVVGQNQAESFFTGALLTSDDCVPPETFPSGRTDICMFRF